MTRRAAKKVLLAGWINKVKEPRILDVTGESEWVAWIESLPGDPTLAGVCKVLIDMPLWIRLDAQEIDDAIAVFETRSDPVSKELLGTLIKAKGLLATEEQRAADARHMTKAKARKIMAESRKRAPA